MATQLFQGKFPYKLTFDFRRKGHGPEDNNDWSTLGVASYSKMLTDYLTFRGHRWSKEREVVYLESLDDAMMVRMIFAERLVGVETTTSILNTAYEVVNDDEDESSYSISL